MIKYELTTSSGKCTVSIKGAWTSVNSIIYEGNVESIAEIKEWLKFQYNQYGHIFDTEENSPKDLAFLINTRGEVFEPVLIAGTLRDFSTKIPKGAIT